MHIRDDSAADIPAILRLEHHREFHTLIGTWPEAKHAKTLADEDSANERHGNERGDSHAANQMRLLCKK